MKATVNKVYSCEKAARDFLFCYSFKNNNNDKHFFFLKKKL